MSQCGFELFDSSILVLQAINKVVGGCERLRGPGCVSIWIHVQADRFCENSVHGQSVS